MANTRGAKCERKCENPKCGKGFFARVADVRRGWARFCSKSCKASEQEKRTGQYAALIEAGGPRAPMSEEEQERADFERDMDEAGGGWDDHKDWR